MDFPVPDNEVERLLAMEAYQIVGSEPEQAFDDLAELAAQICGCQEFVAAVTGWAPDARCAVAAA